MHHELVSYFAELERQALCFCLKFLKKLKVITTWLFDKNKSHILCSGINTDQISHDLDTKVQREEEKVEGKTKNL